MASAAFFSAEVRGELLTLQVRDMPLKHVLEEIARHSGIVVSIQGALEEPVTKVFDDLPIDRALQRLLKDKNYVFLYTRQDADDVTRYRLAEIRIFASDLSPAQSSALNGGRMGIKEAPGREDPDGEEQVSLDVLVSQALHEDEPGMRQKAVRLLGEREGSADEVLDPLIQALDDTDNEVRKSAVLGLGSLKDERIIDPLARALQTDADESVRVRAAFAIGYIGGEHAVDHLRTALQDRAPRVRESAVEALGEIGAVQAVQPLVGAWTDGEIGGQEAITLLDHALQDSDEEVRNSAEKVLNGLLEKAGGWGASR